MQLEIPFKEEKVPFISEVEEFNNVMGKSYQNQTKPTINKADADFVVNFIQEELDELKEAISLREMDGLSYEEISDLMNCPIGTVRSRIFRAREAISEKLKPLIETTNKRW